MPIHSDTARKLLDHLNGRTPLVVTGPLKLYLKGTTTLGSYTHDAPQTIVLSVATYEFDIQEQRASYVATNETAVVFPNMPAMTVTEWSITDSSATPIMLWTGETIRDRDVPQGDSYEVPAGALKVQLVHG